MNFSSFAPVNKKAAQAAAEKLIKEIEDKRAELKEAEIKYLMQSRGLFRLQRTREQAEKYLGSQDYFRWNIWPDWECYKAGDLEEAKELLCLCRVAEGNFVYLSNKHAWIVNQKS
jgi:hypothetical protein